MSFRIAFRRYAHDGPGGAVKNRAEAGSWCWQELTGDEVHGLPQLIISGFFLAWNQRKKSFNSSFGDGAGCGIWRTDQGFLCLKILREELPNTVPVYQLEM